MAHGQSISDSRKFPGVPPIQGRAKVYQEKREGEEKKKEPEKGIYGFFETSTRINPFHELRFPCPKKEMGFPLLWRTPPISRRNFRFAKRVLINERGEIIGSVRWDL
jgi:hypothetical protein